jgi:ankyrin repeat protein
MDHEMTEGLSLLDKLQRLKSYIKTGNSLKKVDFTKMTEGLSRLDKFQCLKSYIKTGNSMLVQWMIDDDPTLLKKDDEASNDIFFYAVANNYIKTVELFLDRMSPDSFNDFDISGIVFNACIYAVSKTTNYNMLKLLLDKACENAIKKPYNEGKIDSYYSASLGHFEIIELLLYIKNMLRGVRDGSGDEERISLFIVESSLNKMILHAIDQLNNDDGRTALHVAASSSNALIIDALLHSNRMTQDEICRVDSRGKTVLHHATANKLVWNIELLLDKNRMSQKAIDQVDQDGNTALHIAADPKRSNIDSVNTKIVQLLLDNTSSHVIDQVNALGKTPIEIALNSGHKKIYKILVYYQNLDKIINLDLSEMVHIEDFLEVPGAFFKAKDIFKARLLKKFTDIKSLEKYCHTLLEKSSEDNKFYQYSKEVEGKIKAAYNTDEDEAEPVTVVVKIDGGKDEADIAHLSSKVSIADDSKSTSVEGKIDGGEESYLALVSDNYGWGAIDPENPIIEEWKNEFKVFQELHEKHVHY